MSTELEPIDMSSFPAELLSQIFTLVKFSSVIKSNTELGYLENLTENIPDIKSIRSTCRRFAQLAAPLLFTIASCSVLDTSSLEAFEQVSRHPQLSRSIKVIRIHLGFYDRQLANDVRCMVQFLSWAWSIYTQNINSSGNRPLATYDKVDKALQEWASLTKTSADLDLNHKQTDLHSETQLRALNEMHAEYRRRYSIQQSIRKSREAIQRVGEAMARMPEATCLVLDDYPHRAPWQLGPLLISALHSTTQCDLVPLLSPLSWLDCWRLKLDIRDQSFVERLRPPFDLIIDIPVAIHRAGVRIAALRIHGLQIPEIVPAWESTDPYAWEREPNTPVDLAGRQMLAKPSELAKSCQGLQVLEITPQYRNSYCELLTKDENDPWPYFQDDSLSQFHIVVDQMYTTSLRKLRLDCLSLNHSDFAVQGDNLSCDDMFQASRWPLLEVLLLENPRIRDARSLLNMLSSLANISEFHLIGAALPGFHDLNSQSPFCYWSYMLNGLREEHHRLRYNRAILQQDKGDLEPPIKITNPFVIDEDYALSNEEKEHVEKFKTVFNREDGGFSRVDDYIMWATKLNPIVQAWTEMNNLG